MLSSCFLNPLQSKTSSPSRPRKAQWHRGVVAAGHGSIKAWWQRALTPAIRPHPSSPGPPIPPEPFPAPCFHRAEAAPSGLVSRGVKHLLLAWSKIPAGSWKIFQEILHRSCTLGHGVPPCSPTPQVADIQTAAQTRLFAARLVSFLTIILREQALGLLLCHYKQVKLSVCLSVCLSKFSTLKPGQLC